MVGTAASTFGAQLRRLRVAAGISQEEPAEAAELSVNAIGALERGERDEAARLFGEGAALSLEMGDRANIAHCVDGLAVIAGGHGQAERGTPLGAAEGLLATVGAAVYNYYLPDRALSDQIREAARAALGEETFAAALEAGRSLTPEQAVAEAQGVTPG
jgi:transcriptional regulator with XRE-family HTH domain